MNRQLSFSELEYASKKKVTRRERFLADIEMITPWSLLISEIAPHYPKSGNQGRQPIGIEKMLRMYIAQQCFGLSDEGIEDAIYDSQSIRKFVGIDLSRQCSPDATTLLKFRRILETNKLTDRIFAVINQHLAQKGLLLRKGTIVDATIIAAPSSTKNEQRQRDPEMHQTKKGNQWYFGMKAHIGVDASSGIVHTVVTTSANVHDVTQAHNLLHGEERSAYGDSGFLGVDKREEGSGQDVQWHVGMRPGQRRALPDSVEGHILDAFERLKAQVRAKVEHPFRIIKNIFGLRKVRYRGLEKNTAQLMTMFAMCNLLLCKRRLKAVHG